METTSIYRFQYAVLLIVIDESGFGMKEADIPIALEQIGQVDNPLGGARGGIGIGLPLVEFFMEMQRRSFEIRSEFGVRTTARLIFPANL